MSNRPVHQFVTDTGIVNERALNMQKRRPIALAAIANGSTIRQAAALVGVSHNTVQYWYGRDKDRLKAQQKAKVVNRTPAPYARGYNWQVSY